MKYEQLMVFLFLLKMIKMIYYDLLWYFIVITKTKSCKKINENESIPQNFPLIISLSELEKFGDIKKEYNNKDDKARAILESLIKQGLF